MDEKKYFIEADDIELKDLFRIIWLKRNFIFFFTFFTTLCSLFYVFFNNPIPLYQGKLLVEIGSIQSENFGEQPFDNVNNLSVLLKNKLNLKVSIPKRTNNLIEITFISTNKNKIKDSITNAFDFIKNRHEEKANFYKSVIMSKKLTDIRITDKPINTLNKKLIVLTSCLIGFILSVFFIFFMNFLKNLKKTI